MEGLIGETTQSGVTVGDAFKLLVSFDSSASLVTTQSGGVFSPGARYEYDPSSLSITMSIGALPDRTFTSSGSSGDLLWLRDNSGDRSCCEAPAVDGLTFQLTDDFNTYLIQAVFRGSILDIFNGPGLPSNPDPRLTTLEISDFSFIEVGGSSTGAITSIYRVPEPGTLALLGLGLAGLGFARRRKTT